MQPKKNTDPTVEGGLMCVGGPAAGDRFPAEVHAATVHGVAYGHMRVALPSLEHDDAEIVAVLVTVEAKRALTEAIETRHRMLDAQREEYENVLPPLAMYGKTVEGLEALRRWHKRNLMLECRQLEALASIRHAVETGEMPRTTA